MLYLIFYTSLGNQQFSYTTLALYNLSLKGSQNYETSCLLHDLLTAVPQPKVQAYIQRGWHRKKKNVSCLEPRTSGPTHHCHCSGVVLKINGCMLTRFDMLHKSSHLWSHDTAKQRKQQAILAKMSDANKSTTICHIVVTKCFGLWGLPWDGGDKKPGLRVLGRRKS